MSGRLSSAVKCFFSRLLSARSSQGSGARGREGVIKGTSGNVIIVKSPDTEYFKEAIFILRDDVFSRGGVSRKQILRDARQAACACASENAPARRGAPLCIVSFLLGAVCCLAIQLLVSIL